MTTDESYWAKFEPLDDDWGQRKIADEWRTLQNKRMAEKLTSGEALSVRAEGEHVSLGLYKLRRFVEGVDYCDPERERWIWSIGRNDNGEIFASTDTSFYLNPPWECLFLR